MEEYDKDDLINRAVIALERIAAAAERHNEYMEGIVIRLTEISGDTQRIKDTIKARM